VLQCVLPCAVVCCNALECVVKEPYSVTEESSTVSANQKKIRCLIRLVCCSVLQCVAVCCSVLQCVALCCSVWQCVAVCGSVLQSTIGTRYVS